MHGGVERMLPLPDVLFEFLKKADQVLCNIINIHCNLEIWYKMFNLNKENQVLECLPAFNLVDRGLPGLNEIEINAAQYKIIFEVATSRKHFNYTLFEH